jgi:hypothetical protein
VLVTLAPTAARYEDMTMNEYKTIRSIADIDEYIGGTDVVAFDFETSPLMKVSPKWFYVYEKGGQVFL